MNTYSADEVAAYARCSLEWYWRYTAKQTPPPTPRDLQSSLLRQTTRLYYDRQSTSLVQGVGLVVRDWCVAWQSVPMYEALQEYITKQIAILAKFSQGQIRKPDGKLYFAPRMSNRYRDLMHAQGMTDLARRLNAFAQQIGILLPQDYGKAARSAMRWLTPCVEQVGRPRSMAIRTRAVLGASAVCRAGGRCDANYRAG